MWKILYGAVFIVFFKNIDSTPAIKPQSMRGFIIFPAVEQFNECYVDEQRRTKGICKKLTECQTVADRWHYENIRPQTCYFNKFDHIVCCEKGAGGADDIRIDENKDSDFPASTPISLRRHELACEEENIFKIAIVGGEPTVYKEHPYMAALGWKGNFGREIVYHCGGVLISRTFVLTAAHCVDRGGELPVVVRTGGVNLTDVNTKDIAIKRFVIHPDYKASTTYNDIALIELMESALDKPACLWSQDAFEHNKVLAIGYGHTRFAGISSDQLLKAPLHLVSNNECEPFYQNSLPNGVINTQVCAKDPEKIRDTCQGDSGGPILMDVMRDTLYTYVVGITSFGLGCANTPPSVYTRVSSYIDWIEDIVWPRNNTQNL